MILVSFLVLIILFSFLTKSKLFILSSLVIYTNYSAVSHFASNYDALHDAFQHVIAPWLAACCFLEHKNKFGSYVMIALPLIFSATFGFVYFSLILLTFAGAAVLRSENRFDRLKGIASKGNFLMLPLFAFFIIYLGGNFMGEKPGSVGFSIFDIWNHLDFYLIFCFAEFFGYAIFLWPSNRNNPLFYIVVVQLLIIPIFSLGMYNDLCSRGSIPARFILMFLCIKYFFSMPKRDWRFIGLTAMLTISIAITGLQFMRHMSRTYHSWNDKAFISDHYKSLEGFAGNPNIRQDEAYNYFTMNYTGSLFYQISR